jgi:hypothetical protein
MRVLPAGSILWHGTGAEVGFRVPRGPAWFSDSRSVAHHFAWLHASWTGPIFPSRVMRYVVRFDLSLPYIANVRPQQFTEVWGTPAWEEFVKHMHEPPDFDLKMDMRHFQAAVCSRYEGWWVGQNYFRKIPSRSLPITGDDILICHPERWLRRTQVSRGRW